MAVTWMSIFNTGILIMLQSAYIKASNNTLSGDYSDFDKDWFENVGSII